MLRIYLVRHGQNEDNAEGILNGHRDRPLTKIGMEQGRELAEKIAATHITFDHTYTSPLVRAAQTATIITNRLGLSKPEILPQLIERDFGVMTGRRQFEIQAICGIDILQTDTICYFLSPHGAETFPDLLERAKKLLAEIKVKHADGNILLVTHGDFGKMIYTAYYNLDWLEVLKMFHFGNSEMLELSEESEPEETHVFRIQQHNV